MRLALKTDSAICERSTASSAFAHAEATGNVGKTCRYFGIGRASFYRWRHVYQAEGEAGLINKSSVPHNHHNKTPPEVAEKFCTFGASAAWGRPTSSGSLIAITASIHPTPGSRRYSITMGSTGIRVAEGSGRFIPNATTRRFPGSYPVGRQVPDFHRERPREDQAVPVHGNRRRHPHPRCAGRTTAMSSRPSFSGMSSPRASVTPTSRPVRRNRKVDCPRGVSRVNC